MTHLTMEELEAGIDHILASPKNNGPLELIVRRPSVDAREELDIAELDTKTGLVGDNWADRGCPRSADGGAHPDMQLNIMNCRATALVAQATTRWKLAGDQLYVDLDLSKENLPAGTQLSIGSAIIEVTAEPHMGCSKFVERFGKAAMVFVNNARGKQHCLRGINAKVVQAGSIKKGDSLTKLAS